MSVSHEHVESKILAKIKTFILSRAKLLFTLWDEIPCTTKFQPSTNLSTNESIALCCIVIGWKISKMSKFCRTIVWRCNSRKLDGLSFSALALSVIKLKWEKYKRLFTLTQIVWMVKVHSFLKQCFAQSLLDTI
jgi:hypothetical protein